MKTTLRYYWGFKHKTDVRYNQDTARATAMRARDVSVGRRMPGREGRTRLRINEEGAPALRYTRTDVVTWLKNGWIELNTDGWETKTSKARIEEYATLSLFSAMRNWWLIDAKGRIHRYYDGMIVRHTSEGVIVKGKKGITLDQFENLRREYNRQKVKERQERKMFEIRREEQRLLNIPEHLRAFNGNPHEARATFQLIKA